MPLGQVTVTNQNLGQGSVREIERHFLFIGHTDHIAAQNKLIRVDGSTDLALALGAGQLYENVLAAKLNAGQNWTASVFGLDGMMTWQEAVDLANETDSFESVVLVDEVALTLEFNHVQAKTAELLATYGRFVSFLVATPGIDSTLQTWADYETEAIALVDGIAAPMVVAVPQLHGNNVGALAGRLCNRAVTIADTPMRVATGSVVGLGAAPVDSDGKSLASSTIAALANARFSVPQTYPDYDGIYWSDASTLEAEGGDYQVLEYVRVVHKVCRRVRIKAIRRIGDRLLNSTPESIEANKQYFASDMRAMAKSNQIGDVQFPGEIMTPEDDDVAINWRSKTHVEIGLNVRPHNCPKAITVNVALDLSNQTDN